MLLSIRCDTETVASLADLTLVIPAYNRPAYLARQIRYWSTTDVKLCILDGSKDSAPESLIAEMGENFHYQHLPIGFNDRLVLASNIVMTKYVALLGDDEIYSIKGLLDCISTLETESALVACIGRALFFYYRDGGVFGHQVYEKSENVPGMYGDDIERLRNSFENGDPSRAPYLLYSMFRTSVWKKIVQASYGRMYSSGYAYELAFQILGSYLGPTMMVNSLTWFRSGENPAMSSEAVNRKISLGEWGISPSYVTEVSLFKNDIIDAMWRESHHSKDYLAKVVNEITHDFISYSLHKPKRPIAYWHRFLYFCARRTPKFVKHLLKRNMTSGLGRLLDYRGVPFDRALDQIREQAIDFDEDEMRDLNRFLTKFHETLEGASHENY